MYDKNIDVITGDPKKAIVKLSIPICITLIISVLYNVVDTIWVSGLGSDALSAIGFLSPLYLVFISFGTGIGAGANSLISRFIGADNHQQANNVGLHAFILGAIVSIIPTILILIFMKPILILIGAGMVLSYAMDYGYIIFLFLFVFTFSTVASAIFRAEGNMRKATSTLILSAVLNSILDPIFIYTLNLGMKGAAWASVISALISCIIMAYWIWVKKDMYLNLTYKDFSLNFQIIKDILNLAIPSTLEMILIGGLSLILNIFILKASGTMAVAVFTASIRIVQVAIIPLNSISTALLTVGGVAYGANNIKDLKTAHSFSIRLSFVLAILIASIMVIFSSQIAILFSYSSASAVLTPQIASTVTLLSLYVLAMPHGLMSSAIFESIGKGFYCLILTVIKSLLLESVFAFLFCFFLGWGLTGIYLGIICGCFLGSVLGYVWVKIFIHRLEEKDTTRSVQ